MFAAQDEFETANESVEVAVVPFTEYTVRVVAKPMTAGYWSQPSTAYVFNTPASGKRFV